MNHIVLLNPAIPENTGNIMRTCAATKTTLHIVKPTSFDLEDKRMKRASLDYGDKLDIRIYEDYDDFLSKNDGYFFFFTRYSNKCYSDAVFNALDKDVYLFFGHEHHGIDKEILLDNLETCLRIPMSEEVRSLNLSNCAALTIYEVLRQQKFSELSFVEVQKGEDFLYDL